MLPRIRHNNFIGAVELFVKSSHTKTHSNNFFNNIQHAFKKKDWVSNYDSLGNDSNLLIVFYVQIMPDDFVMQLHRF